ASSALSLARREYAADVTPPYVRVDFVRRGARPGVARMIAGPRTDEGFEGAYAKALLNYTAAREFRAAPAPPVRVRDRAPLTPLGTAPATPGALGGSTVGQEWRLQVDTTGVWRVTYAQLAARGFPGGVASSALSLARREYAADVTPPYVRVEVPIRIVEGATGVAGTFDGDDAVVFFGQTWRERTRPSENRARFGEHETYYLGALNGSSGMRMAEAPGNLAFGSPLRPTSFPSYRLYERRFQFNILARDTCNAIMTWTDPFSDMTWSDTLTTFTPDPDATGQVRFKAAFQGMTFSPAQHTIWMRWKRPGDGLITPVFTETFFSKDLYAADTVFAADRIAAGTNRLEWRGHSPNFSFPDGGPSGASLWYYEVTYDRLYRAFQNQLDFNSGGAQGDVEIEVDGFTAAAAPAVQVYDVTDSLAPRFIAVPTGFVRPTGASTWAARFQVAVASGERRRFFAHVATPQLPDAAITAMAQENATALWDAPGTPDYLLITHEEFLAPARRIAEHRRGQGYDVWVAPMSEVADTYDGGRRTDWAIRRFHEDAFARWGTRFTMLFGDASEDARGFLATSDRDFVPAHLINGPVGTGNGQELSASEFWYVSDLDRSMPAPPPCVNLEPDLFADMAIGRLSVGTLVQANALADKVARYDNEDRDAAWRRRFLLVPDDPYSYGSFFGEVQPQYCYKFEEEVFENIDNKLERVLVDEAGYRDLDIDHFRLREVFLPVGRPVPGSGSLCTSVGSTLFESMQTFSSTTAAPRFRTELGEGALVVNFQGHGSATLLAHESIFTAFGSGQDIDFVFNENRPFFFLSFSCHVNQFTSRIERRFGDALGEGMLIGPQNPPRPTAGAIATYASTNYELLPADFSGNNHLNVHLFRSLFVDPPNDPLLGERGARVLLGEAINLGSARAQGSLFGLERRAVQTYVLLGDPATPLSIGAPRVYATANDQPVTTGVRYTPGAAGDSIVFVIDLVDESRIDEISLRVLGEGARVVDPSEYVITPSFPDTLNGGGGRRYLLTWTVVPEAKDVELSVTTRDRTGLVSTFSLPLVLEARLFANGQPISDGDTAPAAGTYQFVISSPAQLTAGDLSLVVDGLPVPGAVIVPADTDSSRRLWTVTWEGSYPSGTHLAVVNFTGGSSRSVSFVTSSDDRVVVKDVFAFPTPFQLAPVTLNFTLDSDGQSDVLIKVYSVAGSLVYLREERSLNPGYHQLVWDGNDNRGDALSNGVYTFQVIATDDRGLKSTGRGRLARVR
ncbi:MAG: C25 family cysteine peptidase, partial [Candidatus Eisenbacteria bacterium]